MGTSNTTLVVSLGIVLEINSVVLPTLLSTVIHFSRISFPVTDHKATIKSSFPCLSTTKVGFFGVFSSACTLGNSSLKPRLCWVCHWAVILARLHGQTEREQPVEVAARQDVQRSLEASCHLLTEASGWFNLVLAQSLSSVNPNSHSGIAFYSPPLKGLNLAGVE